MLQVFARMPAGLVVLDGTGCISGYNPAALDLLGVPLAGVRWQQVVPRAFAPHGGKLAPADTRLRDGRRVRVMTAALAPQPGQIIVLVEEPEAVAVPWATAAETAAVLAHQIRTPLAAAVLYVGHLLRPSLEPPERLRLADKLRAALAHLERLVNDILLWVRAGRIEKRPLELPALLAELRELAQPLLAAQDGRLDCPQEIPPLVCLGHREALLTALLNLVGNAVEACGRGARLELAVRRLPDEAAMELVLSDNGPGVPAEIAQRLFEPFFTTRPNGTGLGLAVVRAVARAHGGEVYYAPRPEGGAQFVLRLPICAPPPSSQCAAQGSP